MSWAGSCNSPPWRVGWEEKMCWRSQAGQPAAMQEEGCEALGPRRGSGRTGVLLSRRRLRKERLGRYPSPLRGFVERVKRGRTCLILARWPHRSWGSGWPMVVETCVSCRFSHLCVMLRLLGNWVPLLSRTPNSTCGFQACTWRLNFVHQNHVPTHANK